MRRPVAVTSLLALGLAGAVVGGNTLASQVTAASRRPAPAATVTAAATPAAGPADDASTAPPASADPSSGAEASGEAATDPSDAAPRAGTGPSAGSEHQGEQATLYRGDGSTGTAEAGSEADRVGALFTGSITAGHHSCSASVIHSITKNLVLTAAHCVAGSDGLRFVPGYRDGKAPYGSWQVTKVFTTDGWSQDEDEDEDFAILQIAPQGGRQIEDVVGGNPLGLDAGATTKVRLYGYPDGGEEPLLCTNATEREDTHQRRVDCPSFPGGTSGGPWIDTASGQVIGVIGGYQQGGDTADTSYSATFGRTIGDLYTEAVKASMPAVPSPAPAPAPPSSTPAQQNPTAAG
ncbi:serine protease [Kitasatospora sp. NPDC048540]|uniref:trypsin-like serine peptidase n=1 Tax=Kitasatospora sp. NPDC048540 TaxID=3155634 RepID=UPI000AB793E3